MAKVKNKVTTPNIREIANKMDHSFTVYGNKNGTDTVEINLTVSYEIKHVTQQLHFWTFMSENLKLTSTPKLEH